MTGDSQRGGYVLVTGGAGFLGTNICDALAQRGDDVLIFDNFSRPRVVENADWLRSIHPSHIRIAKGDVRDQAAVKSAVAGASAVIHLAAQVAVTTSLDNPIEDFEINARGTLNVLEAVAEAQRNAPVLFASTNKVYGKLMDGETMQRSGDRYISRECAEGFGEKTPLSFYSPYGCSKGVADQYVLDYAHVFGLRTCVFRMSCLYGPHQYGTEDQGWVAHFLISANLGRPISIYGDGYQVRDVLYVEDAVRAYLLALDNIDQVSGRAFNLGGGSANAISLRELLRGIGELNGRAPVVSYHPWRPGDQLWYVSDTSELHRVLGWRAQVDVDAGLRKLAAWIEEAFAEQHATPERRLAS
ncbi:MAG TPA: SDR family NAD(P)-dependent oxidoreductase [Micropepsaceae bacterium]|jgi:CDP-paratose 2-epimerase|nr:SDR family NAD(P)-dependent oxidoreductase [Micropepsaceae bacterium]